MRSLIAQSVALHLDQANDIVLNERVTNEALLMGAEAVPISITS